MRDCPECGTPIQRIGDGDVLDGLRAHYRVVHPQAKLPAWLVIKKEATS